MTQPTVQEKLAEIRKLLDGLTAEPWFYCPAKRGIRVDGSEWIMDAYVAYGTPGDPSETYSLEDCYTTQDMKFIAAARTLVPALLAVVEAADNVAHYTDTLLAKTKQQFTVTVNGTEYLLDLTSELNAALAAFRAL